MAIRRSERRNKQKQITVQVDGDELAVWYRPAAVTADVVDRLQAGENDQETVYGALVEILSQWDYLDDDGAQIPVSLESIRAIDIPLLTAVITGVMEDLVPGKPSTTGSFGG